MKSLLLAMLFLAIAAFMLWLAFAEADGVQALIDRFAGLLP